MQLLCILRRFVMMMAVIAPYTAHAEGRSIIVLDASGSMWGQIAGQTKLEIARTALAGVLTSIPADTELGLIAYGHREKGSCADIELIVPPGVSTAPAIADAAAKMQFLGKTPLTDAVRLAASELRSTEAKATVILITDGIETCNADPCALGLELEASGVDFTAHVVGFGLTEAEGNQVSCLATNTGGLYITAADLAGLTDALQTTVLAAVPLEDPAPAPEPAPPSLAITDNFAPNLFYAVGQPVPAEEGASWTISQINPDGTPGTRLDTFYGAPTENLPPGTYVLEVGLDEVALSMEITITADKVFAQDVVLNAGRVVIRPRGSDGGAVEPNAAVALTIPNGKSPTYYGATDVAVPAGEIAVQVTLGNGRVEQAVSVVAGQTTEVDIIVGVGIAVVDAFYVDGMKVEGSAHAIFVEDAKKAIDGKRNRIETQYGEAASFTLPPGDYVAVASSDLAEAEVAFSVTTGGRTDVAVPLNAGVMAVTAPGATSIAVFSGKTDIKGNRGSLRTEYVEILNLTAPAGDYLIKVLRGDVETDAAITVKAGERAELTVP